MSRRISFLALVLLMPVAAFAQGRGGGGSRSGGSGGMSRQGGGGGGVVSTKDLQKENMVSFLIDSRKDLELSDPELKALKAINDVVKDSTKEHLKALDSISSALKKSPTTGEILAGRSYTDLHLKAVRERYTTSLEEAISKLTEPHQKAANEFIDEYRQEMAKKKP